MFDNVAFQVVIGLALIYLLYSLLVTIISETIATKTHLRARLLRVALERMLNDGYYLKRETVFETWMRTLFLYEHKDFAASVAGQFYNYPAIKYLGRIEGERRFIFGTSKPSYITADYFAESLINFLADKGSGENEMSKVAFALQFNTYYIQPKTRRQLLNLMQSSEGEKEKFKKNLINWFNETMDRATGWHKRKMRALSFWLGLFLAMSFNVDSIRIAHILAKDKAARSELVNMGVALSRDSARYSQIMQEDDQGNIEQNVLDSAYRHINEDINQADLILGLGWDMDTLTKDKTVTVERDKNETKYTSLLKLRRRLSAVQQYKGRLQADRKLRQARVVQLLDSARRLYDDTALASYQMRLAANELQQSVAKNVMLQLKTKIVNLQKEQTNMSTEEQRDSVLRKTANAESQWLLDTTNRLLNTHFIALSGITPLNGTIKITGRRNYSPGEKFNRFWLVIFQQNGWVGMVLTAFALTLGAPFWFDTLKRLVSIRGVGIKPEEKKPLPASEQDEILVRGAAPVSPPPLPTDSDDVDAAVRQFGPQLKLIPGVKSVFPAVVGGNRVMQVNVADAVTEANVKAISAQYSIGQRPVPALVMICGTPRTQRLIANASGSNGYGTLGCFLIRKRFGSKHILSCWHVLAGDFNYASEESPAEIVDYKSFRTLGERWVGGIRDQYDYGLALCDDNSHDNRWLAIAFGLGPDFTFHPRSVSRQEIDKNIAVKYYDSIRNTVVTGIIYASTPDVDIDYADRTRTVKDILLLTDGHDNAISVAGNSGSIVFDAAHKAIAMIIGGDDRFTYAAKLPHIFRLHSEMSFA